MNWNYPTQGKPFYTAEHILQENATHFSVPKAYLESVMVTSAKVSAIFSAKFFSLLIMNLRSLLQAHKNK